MVRATSFLLALLSACHTVVEGEPLDSLEGEELEYEWVGDMVIPRRAGGEPLVMVQSSPRVQIVFLNVDGLIVERAGWAQDNAQANRSFIPALQTSALPAFDHAAWGADRAAVIAAVIAGVREDFAAYRIDFTTARPVAGPYTQVVMGGSPGHIGAPGGVGGVAPLDVGNWNQNDIVFVFSDEIARHGYDARHLAWTISHELAHSLGLAHIQPPDAIMNPVNNPAVPQRWSEGPTSDRQGFQRDLEVLASVLPGAASLPAPLAPTACGRLDAGHGLGTGVSLASCDGRFRLAMQVDGNLVLDQAGAGPIWASNSAGSGAQVAIMQEDGNFVVYAVGPRATFHTGSHGNPGAHLALQDDGNLVVYRADGAPLWASGTCCR